MAFPPNGAPPMPAAPSRPPMGPPGGAPMASTAAMRTAFHNDLLQRLAKLPPPMRQALATGITPEAAKVLKIVLPEIADIIDKAIPAGSPMPPGAMPPEQEMAGMEQEAGAAPMPSAPPPKPAMPPQFGKPKTRLDEI